MIIVRLMGGLGNQMFQYAAGRALALHKGTTLKLDLEVLLDRSPNVKCVIRDFDLDVFSLKWERASRKEIERYARADTDRSLFNRIRQRFRPTICFREPHFHFYASFFDLPANTHLTGYWQSPKYFAAYESHIRQAFRFVHPILPESQPLLERIQSDMSVCVNVRRGDFLTNPILGYCDMRYFAPAMEWMRKKLGNPHFFVFSDDPAWCIENFTATDTTVVGHEHKGVKFSNYLQLMSRCRHFIIPNSTFAWWAVWFNQNPDKIVIAPKRWFADASIHTADLIPSNWIRMEN